MNFMRNTCASGESFLRRILLLSLAAAGVIVPLIFSFFVKSVFSVPKLYALAIILVIIVAALACLVYRSGGLVLIKDRINTYLGLYGVTVVLSAIFTINYSSSLFGNYGRFMGLLNIVSMLLLTFVVFNFVRSKKELYFILWCMYGASLIIVALGLLQHYGYFLTNLELTAEAGRAFSTLGHANHFGGYIVQMIFIALVLAIVNTRKTVRILILLSQVFFLWALFETSSRGAFLAFVFCMGVLTIFTLVKFREPLRFAARRSLKKIMIGILASVIILGGVAFFARDSLKKIELVQRTLFTIDFIRQGNVPDRVSWIYSSLEMIRDRPLLGFGVSTFQDIYNTYRRTDYYFPNGEQDQIVPEAAHNEYLNIAATQGVPSLIFFLLMVGVVLKSAFKVGIKNTSNSIKSEEFVPILLACSLLAYLVQVFLSFGVFGTMVVFFLVLGITGAYVRILQDEGGVKVEEKILSKSLSVILVGSMILFAGINLFFANRLFKADSLLRATEYVGQIPEYADKGFLPHINLMQDAIRFSPYFPTLYEKLGEFYYEEALSHIDTEGRASIEDTVVVENNLLKAAESYETAIQLNSWHAKTSARLAIIYSTIAELNLAINRLSLMQEFYQKALAAYETTLTISPNNPLYFVLAADTYARTGNAKRAKELYLEAKAIRVNYPGLEEKLQKLETDMRAGPVE